MKNKIFLLLVVSFLFCITGCSNEASINGSAEETKEETKKTEETKGTELSVEAAYSCELGSIRIRLPEDWSYTIQKYPDSESGFGIKFYPNERSDGKVTVRYWEGFGVCGTGLEETETTINGMSARKGIYDDNPYWSFIVLTGEYEGYVIDTENEESPSSAISWWENYGEVVDEILDTLILNESGLIENESH